MTGTRRASARSISSPSRQPCDADVSSNEYAPAARSTSVPAAPTRARRASVQDGLRRGDHHDDVGANERGVDAKRNRAGAADLDEVLALGVVHLDVAVEAPRELRRDQCLELLVARAAREPARDEQRLVSGRNAQPLELGDGRGDRSLARVALRARQRQVRRLDDDRRARPARHERFERLAGEREAQRVADRRADVRDGVPGGGGCRTIASSSAVTTTSCDPASSGIRFIGARRVRVSLGKWVNLELSHRRRTIALGRCPKTLTGAELQLDDAPVRDAELFLVDGNNLAYRAFFALPEELATTEGFPTNALLGFTNMLFKLLSDYKPKGVAVAWDTRPAERLEVASDYKADRRPTPDLLSEQFPFFRPIVEAFGYRNLEFEGWEADDVIATLATRADEAGIRTAIVSTDRDAFQLVSDNVSLMMTPRGVSDVQVYTPDRVEARYGIRPDQIPDFIGLKGDTSDNIPGHSRHRRQDRRPADRAVRLARRSDRARRRALARAAKEHHRARRPGAAVQGSSRRCGAISSSTAIPPSSCCCRPTAPSCARCSGASSSATCSGASTSSTRRCPRNRCASREPRSPGARGSCPRCAAVRRSRSVTDASRLRRTTASSSASWEAGLERRLDDAELVAHDFKALPRLTMEPAEDTMLLAYLIEPGRAGYELDDLAQEYGVEPIPSPAVDDETAALVRHAEIPRRLAPTMLERVRERGAEDLYRNIELPLTAVLAAMEDAGVKIDTYRMGEITARLADRVEELEAKAYELAGEEFMLGSTQQVARILFEKLQLTPGRKGKTGYSTDTRVLRSIRDEHEIVPVIEEWREYSKLLNTYLGPLPSLLSEDGRPAAHDVQPDGCVDGPAFDDEPEPAGDPDPHGARQGDPLGVRAGIRLAPAVGRLLADRAAHPRARVRRAEAPRGVRARRRHPHGDRGRGARQGACRADVRRPLDREDDQLRDRLRNLGVRALGESRDPA